MRVRRQAAAVVSCLLLLAGCNTPSTSPRTLPTLSATPSQVAVPADAATPAGAAAFARYFYAQITRAFATADPSLVAALVDPHCTTCALYLASLTKLRDNHERTTPITFTLHFAEAPATDGRTARVDVQYDVPASTRYDAAGKVIYREKASIRVNETVFLRRVGASWRVTELR